MDGQENLTFTANTTLMTGLHDGAHNVTVYAKDEAGNIGASNTQQFSIAKSEPAPEPIPTALTLVAIASVPVLGIGLLVYLKKIRH